MLGATLIASIVQGMTGVGFSMIVMALLPLVISYTQSAQLALMLTFFFSFYTVIKYKDEIDYKAISLPIIFRFIGGAIGFKILIVFSEHYLTIMLGCMLAIFSLFVLVTDNRIRIKQGHRNAILSGTLSGVFTGIASIGGPPLVVYFLSVFNDSKKKYIASISFCYLIGCIYQLGLHAINGILKVSIIEPFLICLPTLLIGYLIGEKLLMKIKVEKIKKYVYFIILIMGVLITFKEII
jgi:uncharacterized membrane protein YfcA